MAGTQLVDQFNRPMSAVTPLTKDQRITLAGGDLGYMVASNASGKPVTMTTALSISTVWGCISRCAQAMASLPLDLYEKTATGRRRQESSLSDLLSLSPNADQTPVEFWEGMFSWLLTVGNAYAEIIWINGRVSSLILLPSNWVKPIRNKVTRELMYEVREPGVSNPRVLTGKEVLHLRGWGYGGDEGMSPISWGTQTLGSAMAADEAAAKTFASGMQASGILKANQNLDADQRTMVRQMVDVYRDSNNAGKLMVLPAGFDFTPLSLNPDDAQMLETRRYAVEEICRWFGVPPIVIGHSSEGQTMWGTGVEQIFLSWMQLGLNPVLKKVEQRIRKQLIPLHEQRRYYAEFNREAMMQMDSKAKAEFLRAMTSNGIMSRDEARDKLNLERRGGTADDLMVQTAMAPIDQLEFRKG